MERRAGREVVARSLWGGKELSASEEGTEDFQEKIVEYPASSKYAQDATVGLGLHRLGVSG